MKLLEKFFLVFFIVPFCSWSQIIIDHNCTKLSSIPPEWIDSAKKKLHIAYGHTSHGRQLTRGLQFLPAFIDKRGGRGSLYDVTFRKEDKREGALDIRDNDGSSNPVFGGTAKDIGNPDMRQWAIQTREFLNNPENKDINVIMWSWCGALKYNRYTDSVKLYLSLMDRLEKDFPHVKFVYFTGHLAGAGQAGANTLTYNQMIRDFCINNKKILYDFADIESYDPDGNFYGDKLADDACYWDSNNDNVIDRLVDRNWGLEWEAKHVIDVDYYNCLRWTPPNIPSSDPRYEPDLEHSTDINGNLKAYACWWLFARLAGWPGPTTEVSKSQPTSSNLNKKKVVKKKIIFENRNSSRATQISTLNDKKTFQLNGVLLEKK